MERKKIGARIKNPSKNKKKEPRIGVKTYKKVQKAMKKKVGAMNLFEG
ncbi:MAG: hypothetical protein ABH871_05185 [Pseudomonadota bacterium]